MARSNAASPRANPGVHGTRDRYTVQARDSRAEERARIVQDVRQTAAYVRKKGVGVRAAIATGYFPTATSSATALQQQ
eukprot:scaffold48096_cov33-Tisochrysis_lutea.AAC.1